MKISVFGTGYVGLVTSICFADAGHSVTGIDISKSTIEKLSSGESTIYENGLVELLQKNLSSGMLKFSCEAEEGINESDIIFVTVGSPTANDGSTDLTLVFNAIDTISSNMITYKLIVIKSTIPVGTTDTIKNRIAKKLKSRDVNIDFDVAYNPEFLREGCAISDCLDPYRIIIGSESDKAIGLLKSLYQLWLSKNTPFLIMPPASAEMTKYAANSMLATKISLMNEISRLCEKTGANIDLVREGLGSDARIGNHFLFAGLGYGGSCFPKDIEALIQTGREHSEDLKILTAVAQTNIIQNQFFLKKIITQIPDLKDKVITLWGAAFKPNTDDIREAPSLKLIKHFLTSGAAVHIFDPAATENIKNYFNRNHKLTFFSDQYEALKDADALIIPTEWAHFQTPDFDRIKDSMKKPLVFDGRNIYSSAEMKKNGFEYFSIGRP